MANDLVEVQVTEEEVSMLTMSLGIFITMLDEKIERRHNRNERGQELDMEELFFLMEDKRGVTILADTLYVLLPIKRHPTET